MAWRTAQNCLYKQCFHFHKFERHTRSVHQLWGNPDIKTSRFSIHSGPGWYFRLFRYLDIHAQPQNQTFFPLLLKHLPSPPSFWLHPPDRDTNEDLATELAEFRGLQANSRKVMVESLPVSTEHLNPYRIHGTNGSTSKDWR